MQRSITIYYPGIDHNTYCIDCRQSSFRLIAPIHGIKCINPNNIDDTITLIIRLLLIELNINHLKISSSNIQNIETQIKSSSVINALKQAIIEQEHYL